MRLYRPLLALIVFWFFAVGTCLAEQAAGQVQLRASQGEYRLGRDLAFFEDTAGTLTFDEVRGLGEAFVTSRTDVPNFDVTTSVYWARVRLKNDAEHDGRWWLEHAEAMYQRLDLWLEYADGRVVHKQAGSLRPRSDDVLDARGHVFELDIPPGETVTLYLRGETGFVQLWPIRLWQPATYSAHAASESVLHGVFVGIMLAMMLYNLFVYWTLRDVSYLHYVGYMASCLGVQCLINGLVGAHVLTESPIALNTMFVFLNAASSVFPVLFTLTFLRVSTGEKRLLWLFVILMLFCIAGWLVMGWQVWSRLVQITIFSGVLVLMTIGIRRVIEGDVAARYYVMGYGWFLAGVLVFVVTTLGGLPFNALTFHAIEIGSAAEAILLSLALAHRVKQLKQEKDAALQQQIRVERIAFEQEKQLIEQEKMATLGFLSAGVAHEINNPNNFLRMGAETVDSRLRTFRIFLDELADSDAELTAAFDEHFTGLFSQLTLVREGSERINTIVKSMRGASRADSGDAVLFDPAEVLSATIELVRPTFKDAVRFEMGEWPRGSLVKGRPSQLGQVFTNLIVNGCHAIEEQQRRSSGAYQGEIRCSSHCVDGWLTLAVTDNGCGMTEDVKNRLFQPFFTTKGQDRGTGLGLGICKGIIHEHGGRIEVDTVPGQGSTFRVVLPALRQMT